MFIANPSFIHEIYILEVTGIYRVNLPSDEGRINSGVKSLILCKFVYNELEVDENENQNEWLIKKRLTIKIRG